MTPPLEERYRRHHLEPDRRHASLLVALSAPAGLVFALSDYGLFGWGRTFLILLALRVTYALVCGAVAVTVARVRFPSAYDRLLLAWMLFLVVMLVGLDATRPDAYRGHILIEGLVVVFIDTGIRLPIQLQVAAAGVLTASSAILNLGFKESMTAVDATALLVGLTIANVLGFLISLQVDRGRRKAFGLLETEIDLRVSLEKAAAEVQRLRGILPICASCKRIRDEEGDWQQIELYIMERSDADFSHGLCPICTATALRSAREPG